jgi:metallo-beta-lactamase family protein
VRLRFVGGAGEVTGSCHLVEVRGHRVLLDCRLIQGSRADEARNREPFPFDPAAIDAVVLSHAHIDHSGRLPLLVKDGFRGTVYTHRATCDLCRIMLRDAASLGEKEAQSENTLSTMRRRPRSGAASAASVCCLTCT